MKTSITWYPTLVDVDVLSLPLCGEPHSGTASTLAVREVVNQPDTPAFGSGTAVVEVGDELWVGSFRGNRIAILPAP